MRKFRFNKDLMTSCLSHLFKEDIVEPARHLVPRAIHTRVFLPLRSGALGQAAGYKASVGEFVYNLENKFKPNKAGVKVFYDNYRMEKHYNRFVGIHHDYKGTGIIDSNKSLISVYQPSFNRDNFLLTRNYRSRGVPL